MRDSKANAAFFRQGGADPGKTGAIARIRFELATRRAWLSVHAMPTAVVTKAGRTDVSPAGIATLLRRLELDALVVERVFTVKDQSVEYTARFWQGRGAIVGAAAALGIPTDEPTASSWKAKMASPSKKSMSRARASQLMPLCAQLWSRDKDHDEAEAATMALYGLLSRGLIPTRVEPDAELMGA